MKSIADRIAGLGPEQQEDLRRGLDAAAGTVGGEPIALIGMACRFPGANGPQAFWQLLRDGRDAVGEIPAQRWDSSAGAASGADGSGTVSRWAGLLDDVAGFDAGHFGITPREATAMDPQQRLLLETAVESLDDAGLDPDALRGSRTGLFAGVYYHDYQTLGDPDAIDAYTSTGNAHSVTVGRICYQLDLRGPNVAVDTACSSSLVAIHLACQSLRMRESDLALAGGVNVMLSPRTHLSLARWGMMSPGGRCRSFDAGADGFVRGEGVGLVVLKRLADAVRDGDDVLAVVRGSAVNADGRSQGLTAPNGVAQRDVLQRAVAAAGIDPRQVGLVETHGTGTPIGDPIEFEALAAVYGQGSGRCALGAVKTNIGHLEAAAGIAGVIKAVLALRHGVVPANLHFTAWNPDLDPDGVRFFVPTAAVDWPVPEGPRIAAVSSFGFGGTNAHLVLEGAGPAGEHEHREPRRWSHTSYWLPSRPGHTPAETAGPGPGGEATRGVPPEWVSRVEWVPVEGGSGTGTPRRDSWLVLGGDPDADRLATALRGRVAAARAGRVDQVETALDGVDRVVYLAPGPAAGTQTDRAHRISDELLGVVRALRGRTDPPRLHLLTRQAVAPDGGAPDPAQATLTGWARGIAVECPQLWTGLLDAGPLDTGPLDAGPLDTAAFDVVAGQLLAEAAAGDGDDVDDQVAYRDGVRLVPRLRPATLATPSPLPLSGSGTWLVVGANGAVGGLLLGELVELGVRHFTLVSRRGVTEALAHRLGELGGRGAQVVDVVADAADEAAMQVLFARFGTDLPELAGVVLAGFAGGPVALPDLELDAVRTMFRPKVDAAALLDRLSRRHSPAHVLLFSSTTGVLGSRSLAHYAAASAFLDALALARAAEGLPATVVDWGIWASRLAAVDDASRAAVTGSGLLPMDDGRAISVLGPLLSPGAPTRTVVAAADWPMLASAYGTRHRLRVVEDLAGRSSVVTGDGALLAEVQACPPSARVALVRTHVRREAAAVMGITEPSRLPGDAGFFQLGMDSLMSLQLVRRLSASLGLDLAPSSSFNHPTVDDLADHLLTLLGMAPGPAEHRRGAASRAADAVEPLTGTADPVAVVGVGCRFPGGAEGPAAFWDLLSGSGSGIVEVPPSRWDIDRYHHHDHTAAGTICSRHGGFLTGWSPDEFDARFFGISPREAESMDPQQRLLLEVTVEALAHAGLAPDGLRSTPTGVFIGLTTHDYLIAHARSQDTDAIDAYTTTGNAANFAAGRLAYHLGLEGPSLAVDTACSSSLTAIHLALQALRTGDARVAVAGGVNLMLTPDASISFSRWGMLSASGACRSFDDEADGFVRGEGCGVLVLKRLRDAERDGDRVLAVILGSAANQDGRSSGQTVPSGPAQEAVIREALRRSGLSPADIDYVEGHGAGTPLGDPIELDALGAVFGPDRAPDDPLLVGSVKTNVGHLEAAAGVAGVIKAVLSLHEGAIPANLHRTRLSRRVGPAGAALRVPGTTRPWPRRERPARAGVSAFGASGMNVHLVLEEAGTQVTGRGGVWLFSGQGSQWPGMGAGLLADEEAFGLIARELGPSFLAEVGVPLLDLLSGRQEAEGIDQIQPLLFVMQVGLAAVWRAHGVEPEAVVGHSMGEVAAAVVAGGLSPQDGLRVIARRSHLLRSIAGNGAMAVLERDPVQAQELVAGLPGVEVAVHAAPQQTVVSGPLDAVRLLVDQESARGRFVRLVKVDVASHSAQVDPLLPRLHDALSDLRPRPPAVPFLSTVVDDDEPAFDAAYWVANLRRPVRFTQAVARALALGHHHFVEVSPHPLLAAAVLGTAADRPVVVTHSLRRDEPRFTAGRSGHLPPPVWNRSSYWFRSGPGRQDGHPLLGNGVPTPDGRWVFRADVGLGRLPWLADHAVQGHPVLPAAALVEAVVGATVQAGGVPAQQVRVDGLDLLRLLPLTESTPLTVVLARLDADRFAITVHTTAADGTWVRHCTATTAVLPDPAAADPQPPVPQQPEAEAAEAEAVTAEELYERLRTAGQEHGTAFRTVTRAVVAADGTVTGDLDTSRTPPGGRQLNVPPTLLDGALQLLAAAPLPADGVSPSPELHDGGGTAVLPVRIGRVDVLGDVRTATTARARLRAGDQPDRLLAELTMLDARQHPVLVATGIEIARLGAASRPGQEPVYVCAWQADPIPAAGTVPPTADRFVLVAEDLADPLAASVAGHLGGDLVAAGDRAGLTAALRSPARAVVLVGARPGSGPPGSAEAATATAAAATMLVVTVAGAVLAAGLRDVPRLYLVSRGGVRVSGTEQLQLAQAPWRGVARVLAYEHPELKATLLDLDLPARASGGALVDGEPAEATLSGIVAAELTAAAEDADVCYRDGTRLVARLRPATPGPRAFTREVDVARTAVVLRCPEPTGPAALRLERAQRTPPGPGEVEVRVHAAGLNFSDVLKVHGAYPQPPGEPTQIGGEFAGTVTAVGPGVDDLQPGRPVMGLARETFGSYVRTSRDLLVPVPEGLTMVQAATVPVAFVTAWYALHHVARLSAGQQVLIHSATGGVGLAAVAIARSVGARIHATAGSPAKREYLRGLGIQDVDDSRDLRSFDRIAQAAGAVDVVLNSRPGEAVPRGLRLLAPGGHFVELGKADTSGHTPLDLGLLAAGVSLTTVDLDGALQARPELGRLLLTEVSAEISAGRLAPLPVTVFDLAGAGDAVDLMARAGHIGKLVLTVPQHGPVAVVSDSTRAVTGDGAYIVTGGLRGLGLATATWLAEQGAGRIVLNGRTRPGPDTDELIATLRAGGTEVEVVLGDVAADGTAARLVAAALDGGRPLRGIIHSAAVLADATLLRLDEHDLARVLHPKVAGAWQLHRACEGHHLDFFVLYSSAASLLGSPGQTAYAAANAWLDALAGYRRAAGLPAVAVNWGPWGEVGLATGLGARGYQVMSTAQGLAQLDRLVRSDAEHAGVFALDARHWRQSFPAVSGSPYLAELAGAAVPTGGRGAVGEELHALPPHQRRARLLTYVSAQCAGVLRRGQDRPDPRTPFAALGLDSLMALELRNRLESGLGLALPATLVWACPDVATLVDDLGRRLDPPGGDPVEPGGPDGGAEIPHPASTDPADPDPDTDPDTDPDIDRDIDPLEAALLDEIVAHLSAEDDHDDAGHAGADHADRGTDHVADR